MDDQRKYPRIDISFPVECNLLPKGSYFYTVSKDLSLGGVKIITNVFLPKNDYLRLNINLIDKVVDLKAKVAWCNKERVSERYDMGLEFVEINEDGKKDISQFLNKVYQS